MSNYSDHRVDRHEINVNFRNTTTTPSMFQSFFDSEYRGVYITVCCVRLSITIISVFNTWCTYKYYYIQIQACKAKHEMISGSVWSSHMRTIFFFDMIISFCHIPPFVGPNVIPKEYQLIVIMRFWQILKVLKEHNELRYHRLSSMLTSLAKITFEDTVLIKTHLIKHPLKCLGAIYLFCVFVLGYVVFAFERLGGHEQSLMNMIWLINSLSFEYA